MVVIMDKDEFDDDEGTLDLIPEAETLSVQSLFVELIQETAIWVNCRENTINQLLILADSLDKVKFDVNVSQTVGSSVAVVGGITAVAGGVMSLMTMGLAAPVAIAGIAMSTAGSLTAAGASIAEHVISKEKTKEMTEIFTKDQKSSEKLDELSGKLSSHVKDFASRNPGIDEKEALLKMVYNASKMSINVAVNTARISEQVASAMGALTMNVGTKLFRGTNIVLGAVLIPFDVAQIVISGKSLHNGSKSDIANEIRSAVEVLQTELEEGKMFLKVMKEEFRNVLDEGIY